MLFSSSIFITIEILSNFDRCISRYGFIKNVYTLFLVIFGWVLFRANNITHAIEYFKAMLGVDGRYLFDDYFTVYLVDLRLYKSGTVHSYIKEYKPDCVLILYSPSVFREGMFDFNRISRAKYN